MLRRPMRERAGSSPLMKHRVLQPELMDDPALPAAEHRAALRGLARINVLSFTARALWTRMKHVALASPAPVRVLDIAAGSGDVILAITAMARTEGIPIDAHVLDISQEALDVAGAAARIRGLSLTTHRANIVAGDYFIAVGVGVGQRFDIVLCSLFLHHLKHEEIVLVLQRARELTLQQLLVSDLRRCSMGLAAAHVAGRLLTRSPVVRTDSVRSVRAALTPKELGSAAQQARLNGHTITDCWPFRMVMEWRPTS